MTQDAMDYAKWFTFKNTSKKLARITYRQKVYFLEPGEATTVKVFNTSGEIPQVDLLNNGVYGEEHG
jgi:hypothetical protein